MLELTHTNTRIQVISVEVVISQELFGLWIEDAGSFGDMMKYLKMC